MRDWYKMLKKLIFVFIAYEIIQQITDKRKKSDCSNKKASIATDRLRITPMSTSELKELIAQTEKTDKELAEAYTDMLNGCKKYPDEFLWYTAWKITSKATGEMLGDLCFKGLPENKQPEIGYGIIEEHRGKGYATEAVHAMCEWALNEMNMNAVEAETAPDNEISKHVLEKCGFGATGENGEEGPRFIKTKEN